MDKGFWLERWEQGQIGFHRAETNPALVAAHDDWVRAWFTADRATHTVTVIAHWTDPASYEALRSSPDFGATMGRFADHFAGPPSISIHEILVAM